MLSCLLPVNQAAGICQKCSSANIETFVDIFELVRPAVFIPVKSVGGSFAVAFKTEKRRIPLDRSSQFPGDIEQTAERIGAGAVFNRCNGVLVGSNGINEVLHMRCAHFILACSYLLFFLFEQGLVGTFYIATGYLEPSFCADELDTLRSSMSS